MTAEIISVGTELLLGDIVNTNAQYLATQLAGLGFTVHFQSTVGDNPVRLRNFLQTAKERSDILIITGGLGPTTDDITKETAALIFNDRLVMDEEELFKISEFFSRRGKEMTENNKKQALVPHSGQKLVNNNGTATGAVFRNGSKYAFLLPGPPFEMQPMFEQQVLPILETLQDSSIRSLTLRVTGIGESELENKAYQLLINDNPTAALYAKEGEVHIRITANAPTAAQADVMCSEYAGMFHRILGENIYTDKNENLEDVVVGTLIQKGESLATAESCTGGILSSRITSVPGSSAVFGFGAVSYANEFKQQLLGVSSAALRRHGAVSSQVAAEMAFGAIKKSGADYAISITGVAGPGGGTPEKGVGLVYVAVANRKTVYIRRLEINGRSRAYVRGQAAQNGLDMLRRLLMGAEVPDARSFRKNENADYERVNKPTKKFSAVLRPVIAVLLVLAVLAGIMLAANYFRSPSDAGTLLLPSAQGFSYPSEEYSAAAMEYVANMNKKNPAVSGFLAFQSIIAEQSVQTLAAEQSQLLQAAKREDVKGTAVISSAAKLGISADNTLVTSSSALISLEELLNTENLENAGFFSYFTQYEERIYDIFAVYRFDENNPYDDGFLPLFTDFYSPSELLEYNLGTKMRSVYEYDIMLSPNDSIITICVQNPNAVEGVHTYICGRLVSAGANAGQASKVVAGSPLLIKSDYDVQGLPAADIDAYYSHWLRRYFTAGQNQSILQLEAGMPQTDKGPYLANEPSDDEKELPFFNNLSAVPQAGVFRLLSSTSESSESSTSGSESGQATSSGPAEDASSISEGDKSETQADGDENSEDTEDTEGQETPQPKPTPAPTPEPTPPPQKADGGYLTVTMNGEIITAPAADIIGAICQRQAAFYDDEVVKALAVCSYTWILNQYGAGNEAPEVLGALPSEEVKQLVKAVEGFIISTQNSGGEPAFTPWHEMSANATNSSQNVWRQTRSYLEGAISADDKLANGWLNSVNVSTELLKKAAQNIFGEINAELPPTDWIGEIVVNEGGYVESIELFGQSCTGIQLWQSLLLPNGENALPSPAFEVSYNGEDFVFACYGKGHGCGLSLVGANLKTLTGANHADILQHYFPDTHLTRW